MATEIAWGLPRVHDAAGIALLTRHDDSIYMLMALLRKEGKPATARFDKTLAFTSGKRKEGDAKEACDAKVTADREFHEETQGLFHGTELEVASVCRNNGWIRYLQNPDPKAYIVPTFVCWYKGPINIVDKFQDKGGEVRQLVWVNLSDMKRLDAKEPSDLWRHLFPDDKNMPLTHVRTIPRRAAGEEYIMSSYSGRTVFSDLIKAAE